MGSLRHSFKIYADSTVRLFVEYNLGQSIDKLVCSINLSNKLIFQLRYIILHRLTGKLYYSNNKQEYFEYMIFGSNISLYLNYYNDYHNQYGKIYFDSSEIYSLLHQIDNYIFSHQLNEKYEMYETNRRVSFLSHKIKPGVKRRRLALSAG